jgi:hypothetical protein
VHAAYELTLKFKVNPEVRYGKYKRRILH